MKKLALIAAITALLTAPAFARDKSVTYVGGGRYYCSDNSSRCAQVRQNNDALEEARAARDEARRDREAREQDSVFRTGKSRDYDYTVRSHRYDADDSDDED